MAEETIAREPDQGFIGHLVPDPAKPPELRLLVGYPGASSTEGHTRLYASPDLNGWWEIPEDAVLHRQNIPGDPLGAEILWIRRDQQPVLNQGRNDFDMHTYTAFTTFPCGTSPVGAAAPAPQANQPNQTPGHFSFATCIPTVCCETAAGTPQHATGPVQHLTFHLCTVPPPSMGCVTPFCGTTPVAAGAQAVPPTQFCTTPPVTIGCQQQQHVFSQICTTPPSVGCHQHGFSQACTTTPVGAALLPPTFHFGLCTVPPVSTGCPYTPPAGAAQAQAQAQPSLHGIITIPPYTVCCR